VYNRIVKRELYYCPDNCKFKGEKCPAKIAKIETYTGKRAGGFVCPLQLDKEK
jgi:hypothetical protein